VSDYLNSERFAIKEIAVEGLRDIAGETVTARLEPLRKSTLWLADYKSVFAGVKEKHPRIEKISFRRIPPGKILVRITERSAVALIVGKSGRPEAVDRRQARFEPTDKELNNLPVIENAPDESADGIISFLNALGAAAPAFKVRIKKISLDAVSLRLTLDDGTLILWGDVPNADLERASSKTARALITERVKRIETVLNDAEKRFGGCEYLDITQSAKTLERVVVMPRGKKI
ncbi:MAG: FtsQ-type POTRA domain-containing protein, partial [Endomicrobiia bacterium]|nr:FtsQ-type POTRA domain-containing protein [Endomicrobiia bacterium]